MNHEMWPENLNKPALPDGYRWEMLSPGLGLLEQKALATWYIRLSWRMRGGKRRMLKIRPEYFYTAEEAIDAAIRIVQTHKAIQAKRRG